MPADDAHTPISHPAAPSASSSRAAYGAPDAPVIPRKTCTSRLPAGALRRREELGELLEVLVAEALEHGHHLVPELARVRDVALEVGGILALLRADLGQVGRAEVRGTLAGVGVTARAAGLEEELDSGSDALGQIVRRHDLVDRLLVRDRRLLRG